MKLFTGNANPALARGMADYLGIPLGEALIDRFPDGEIFVKICENVRGKDVFIVQPICFPPNENLMELLIMLDAASRASAARITAVIPYYGYARQDRKDQPRVPITAKLVANLLAAAGAGRILGLDFHAQQVQGFFDIPVDHLYGLPVIAKYIASKKLDNLVVVSPDPGGLKMAVSYTEALEAGLALVGKKRIGPEKVEAISVVGDVEGATAVMVDDLTTTASTLCAAAEILKRHGAGDIYAAVTHAVLVPAAIDRLKESPIKELVVTDTVPLRADPAGYPVKVLTVAELLGEAVARIHEGESVSSLFNVHPIRENA